MNTLDSGNNQRQTKDTNKRNIDGIVVKPGNERRCTEHDAVQCQTNDQIEVENGREIQVIGVLLLNECSPQSAVNEYLQDRGEDRHKGNDAVILRRQQSCQHNGNNKGNELRSTAFCEAPDKVGDSSRSSHEDPLSVLKILNRSYCALFLTICRE